ncbi:MAG: hypothetical protein ACJA0G_000560 [Kangiellaceae bacterium]|jgi:hypothetical protein
MLTPSILEKGKRICRAIEPTCRYSLSLVILSKVITKLLNLKVDKSQ